MSRWQQGQDDDYDDILKMMVMRRAMRTNGDEDDNGEAVQLARPRLVFLTPPTPPSTSASKGDLGSTEMISQPVRSAKRPEQQIIPAAQTNSVKLHIAVALTGCPGRTLLRPACSLQQLIPELHFKAEPLHP